MGFVGRLDFETSAQEFTRVPRVYIHEAGFKEVYGGQIKSATQHLLEVLFKKRDYLFIVDGQNGKGVSYTIPVVWGAVENGEQKKIVDLLSIVGIEKPDENPETKILVIENFEDSGRGTCGESIGILWYEIKHMWDTNDFNVFASKSPTPGVHYRRLYPGPEQYIVDLASRDGLRWALESCDDPIELKLFQNSK